MLETNYKTINNVFLFPNEFLFNHKVHKVITKDTK
jgi:hypothetical protein